MALSLQYEQALQSLVSSVSLAYWDYSLEGTFYNNNDDNNDDDNIDDDATIAANSRIPGSNPTNTSSSFRDSIVFSEDIFGETNPGLSRDHVLSTGRFAFVPVMQNATLFSAIYNTHLILSAPWNTISASFLTRANTVYDVNNYYEPASCTDFASTLTYRDFLRFSTVLNDVAHGHLHEMIGGSWHRYNNNNLRYDESSPASYAAAVSFAHNAQKYSKILWRQRLLSCSRSALQCTCDASLYNTSLLPYLLFDTGILSSGIKFVDPTSSRLDPVIISISRRDLLLPLDNEHSVEDSLVIYAALRDVLCDMGEFGDMFQATSSNDVIFWFLHTNIERLFAIQWYRSDYYHTVSFTNNWQDIQQLEDDEDDDENGAAAECPGHRASDASLVHSIFRPSTSTTSATATASAAGDTAGEEEELYAREYYSNEEMLQRLHPFHENASYLYDTIDFMHCKALFGLDLWEQ
jgi:hypothetical protein